MSVSRSPALVFFVLPGAAVAACSTIDEGGTSTSAGTGPFVGVGSGGNDGESADETGEPPLGPEHFDYCVLSSEGTEFLLGWQITCTASAANRAFVNPLDESFMELQDVAGPFGNICCGGVASVIEADADCKLLCLEHICEAARVQHVAWAVDMSNDGMGGDCLDVTESCGFDFELCTTGALHEQVGNPGALFSYFLQVECEAAHDQALSPYSTQDPQWEWVEDPNDPSNDPVPLCQPAPEPEPGPTSASVDGVPLLITGYNTGHVDGIALPSADTMTLTNLVFGFGDGFVDAALELNINGTYARHAPVAVIKMIDDPTECASPVTFEAASHDLDQDVLTHMWWVPPWFLGTGTLLEATLPPGTYDVYLTSFDASGRFDSTAREYLRSCQ